MSLYKSPSNRVCLKAGTNAIIHEALRAIQVMNPPVKYFYEEVMA